MNKIKGYLTTSSAEALAVGEQTYNVEVDGNAIITSLETDKRSLDLAFELIGAKKCPIWVRCRIKPSDANAPRIWVGCLAAYNAGKLYGWWIDADQEPEEILEDIEDMLAESPVDDAEEWLIFDSENFGSIKIDELQTLEDISQIAKLLSDSNNKAAIAAYIDWRKSLGNEIEDLSLEDFQEKYVGHYDSPKDFALKSEEIDELYQFSELEKQFPFWSNFIDWEQVGKELELMDAYYYAEAHNYGRTYGIFAFRNH